MTLVFDTSFTLRWPHKYYDGFLSISTFSFLIRKPCVHFSSLITTGIQKCETYTSFSLTKILAPGMAIPTGMN